jgi:hypothetical protein
MSAKPEGIRISVGDVGCKVMPASEVMMHMKLTGKECYFKVLNERMVQLIDPDNKCAPIGGPVTHGEAGIYNDSQGLYYYYQ